MDNLGIDKLIEMIEERFGKTVAHAFLLLIMLAVGAAAIHYVFAWFIIPATNGIYNLIQFFGGGKISEFTAKQMIFNGLLIATAFTFGCFLANFATAYISSRIKKMKDDVFEQVQARQREVEESAAALHQLADQVRDYYGETRAKIDASFNQIEARMKVAAAMTEEAGRAIELAEQKISQADQIDEGTDTPPPQGTESKT